MSTVALIVAAGQGERAGLAVPKQFASIAGKAVVAHAFDSLARHSRIDDIVVVTGPDQRDALAQALEGRAPLAIVDGGATRRESVRHGLAAFSADRVLIHDAARPFVPGAVIDRLLTALVSAPGAIPALPVADTLLRGNALVDRTGLLRVQTPQAFHAAAIRAAHADLSLIHI